VFGGAGRTSNIFMDDSSVCRAALSVGVGSLTSPFFVDVEVVAAEPAYEGRLHMANSISTFNYVWHKWDWSENPKYRVAYTTPTYACCSNPGAGAVPHLGDFTPTAEFRMRYDGVKWVNRVAFSIVGGEVPPEPQEPQVTPAPPIEEPGRCRMVPQCPEDGEQCCGQSSASLPSVELPAPDCSKNMAIQFNGDAGDGAELENAAVLEAQFQLKAFKAVTVEMWVKDNTMPMQRTVYFGSNSFKDDQEVEAKSCITSGFALGQWDGMLTFDVATEGGLAGSECGDHVRSPAWALGTHKGKWVHVAGTYSETGQAVLYIDGKIVHRNLEGSGRIVWPGHDNKFVFGRSGDFLHSLGGTSGMDGELDEIRVWTEARSLNDLVNYMHKTMPDNGAFGPFPMATVALYMRFECQGDYAGAYHRLCSNAEWPMAIQLGSHPTTQLVESAAPVEIMLDPDYENCPSLPESEGPTAWDSWAW